MQKSPRIKNINKGEPAVVLIIQGTSQSHGEPVKAAMVAADPQSFWVGGGAENLYC